MIPPLAPERHSIDRNYKESGRVVESYTQA